MTAENKSGAEIHCNSLQIMLFVWWRTSYECTKCSVMADVKRGENKHVWWRMRRLTALQNWWDKMMRVYSSWRQPLLNCYWLALKDGRMLYTWCWSWDCQMRIERTLNAQNLCSSSSTWVSFRNAWTTSCSKTNFPCLLRKWWNQIVGTSQLDPKMKEEPIVIVMLKYRKYLVLSILLPYNITIQEKNSDKLKKC